MDLGTVRDRDKLKPQREPYWQKLATGQYLGYRPSKIGKGGTWIARYYDADAGKQSHDEAERHAHQHQAEGIPLQNEQQPLDQRVEHPGRC